MSLRKYTVVSYMSNIMTIRTNDKLKCLLKDKAKELGITRNALVTQILWEWIKNNNVERTKSE
nr:MAG TPA: antitoxin [Caudoviricetes sp.]DAJ72790.1 MAG TPA: antitoxin [Caudoviricetes sp.]